jgi:fructosamine-3-kinase
MDNLILAIILYSLMSERFTNLQSVLGRKLAEMHKAGKSEKGFGFDVDNTIGRCNHSGNCCCHLCPLFSDANVICTLTLKLIMNPGSCSILRNSCANL